jgi:inorganic pyrophosphatase
MPEALNPEFWEHLDRLVARSEIIIDRPRDSQHPNREEIIYPLDYGYLAGTSSADGAGIDVWLGAGGGHDVRGVICTVDLFKKDSEVKVLLGCTRDEMRTIVSFLNQGEMRCLLVER